MPDIFAKDRDIKCKIKFVRLQNSEEVGKAINGVASHYEAKYHPGGGMGALEIEKLSVKNDMIATDEVYNIYLDGFVLERCIIRSFSMQNTQDIDETKMWNISLNFFEIKKIDPVEAEIEEEIKSESEMEKLADEKDTELVEVDTKFNHTIKFVEIDEDNPKIYFAEVNGTKASYWNTSGRGSMDIEGIFFSDEKPNFSRKYDVYQRGSVYKNAVVTSASPLDQSSYCDLRLSFEGVEEVAGEPEVEEKELPVSIWMYQINEMGKLLFDTRVDFKASEISQFGGGWPDFSGTLTIENADLDIRKISHDHRYEIIVDKGGRYHGCTISRYQATEEEPYFTSYMKFTFAREVAQDPDIKGAEKEEEKGIKVEVFEVDHMDTPIKGSDFEFFAESIQDGSAIRELTILKANVDVAKFKHGNCFNLKIGNKKYFGATSNGYMGTEYSPFFTDFVTFNYKGCFDSEEDGPKEKEDPVKKIDIRIYETDENGITSVDQSMDCSISGHSTYKWSGDPILELSDLELPFACGLHKDKNYGIAIDDTIYCNSKLKDFDYGPAPEYKLKKVVFNFEYSEPVKEKKETSAPEIRSIAHDHNTLRITVEGEEKGFCVLTVNPRLTVSDLVPYSEKKKNTRDDQLIVSRIISSVKLPENTPMSIEFVGDGLTLKGAILDPTKQSRSVFGSPFDSTVTECNGFFIYDHVFINFDKRLAEHVVKEKSEEKITTMDGQDYVREK